MSSSKNQKIINKSPPSTRETSYLTTKPRIFSPFVPSYQENPKALDCDFFLDLKTQQQLKYKRKPIIDMVIDIGGNIEKRLLIYEGAESSSLARQFCIENNLDLRCCSLISREIEKQIMNYYVRQGSEVKKNKKKQNSLHNIDKNHEKKLKKNLSVKSFKEDLSSDSDFSEHSKSKRGKSARINAKTKKEFTKARQIPIDSKEEEQNYSFKPKINGPNSLFYENTDPKQKRYEQLYSKHLAKQKKKSKVLDEYISQTCTFHPEINNTSSKNIREKKEVGDRLHEFSQKWEKNRKERELFEKNYDLKTGQKLYHPVIKKDKYYEKAKAREMNENEIKIITEEENQKLRTNGYKKPPKTPTYQEKQQKSIKVTEKNLKKSSSDKRIAVYSSNNQEDKALKSLFDSLDANKDGLISRNQLDFSKLDDNLLEIIANLALEAFPPKQVVDFEGFVKILEQQNVKTQILKVFFKQSLKFKNS